MKGQITLEIIIAFTALILAVHLMVSTQTAKNSEITAKTNELTEAIKASEISAFCNLMYAKEKSISFSYFPKTSVENSRVKCYSDDYYFGSENPGVDGVKQWF